IVRAFHLVLVVIRRIAMVLDVLYRHLRLRRRDDAVVVLGMLQVILGDHPVAGALGVTRKLRVLVGDLLRGPADLHVRAVAFIIARKRIRPLPVLVIIVAAAAIAAAHAPVLLLWPHKTLLGL